MPLQMRYMLPRDYRAVVSLDSPEPWTVETLRDRLNDKNCIGLVLEDPVSRVINGYLVYALTRYSCQVLSLCIEQQHQRQGLGTCLLQRLTSLVQAGNKKEVVLQVQERNLSAQLFLRKLGFRAVSICPNSPQDIYIMRYPDRVIHNRLQKYFA